MDKDCKVFAKVIEDSVIKTSVSDVKVVDHGHTDANAQPEDVLVGQTFYSRYSTNRQTGTMNPSEYAPIQSISKNGELISPDDNKNVNIVLDKNDVGLSNVNNTSDLEKPISTATSEALTNLYDTFNESINTLEESVDDHITAIENTLEDVGQILNDKASLKEENTYVGKQNFNGEIEVNSISEFNNDININNSSINIRNAEKDAVTSYFTDRIIINENGEDISRQIDLPKTSGMLLTDNDISIKYSEIKNFDTDTEKVDKWKVTDSEAKLKLALETEIDITEIFLERNHVGLKNEDSEGNSAEVTVSANGIILEAKNGNNVDLHNLIISKDGISITGKVKVQGDTDVSGIVTVKETETLKVKDNIIVTNSDGVDLLDLSGVAINKNSTDTYGVVYDSTSDAVKLGLGKIDVNGKFSFNSGEGSPIAVRSDASLLTNNNLIKWDATNKKLIDSNISTEEIVLLTDNQTITGTKNFSTRPQYNGIGLATVDDVSGGATLYDTTGENTDGAMTQKATTDAIANRLVKSDFGIYVGSNDACSDSDGNFGQCSNIYNNDGTFYTSRKFLFNKDDFSQDGDDASKIYSISENIARVSSLENYVPKKTAPEGQVKAYTINGEDGEDVCLVSMNGDVGAIARYNWNGQINVAVDPENNNNVTRKSWVESQLATKVDNNDDAVAFAESERQKSKNLFDYSNAFGDEHGITNNYDGTFNINTIFYYPSTYFVLKDTIPQGTKLTFSEYISEYFDSDDSYVAMELVCYEDEDANSNYTIMSAGISSTGRFSCSNTLNNDCKMFELRMLRKSNNTSTLTGTVKDIMICVGDDTDYQAYNGEIVHEKDVTPEIIFDIDTKNTIGAVAYTDGIKIGTTINYDFSKYEKLIIYSRRNETQFITSCSLLPSGKLCFTCNGINPEFDYYIVQSWMISSDRQSLTFNTGGYQYVSEASYEQRVVEDADSNNRIYRIEGVC